MVRYINTPADFYAMRAELEAATVYVDAKGGRIRIPCINTLLVNRSLIRPNSYNPNFVPSDKMRELEQSIKHNGFCFPVATVWDDETEHFVIVDGAHRTLISGDSWLQMEYTPLVWLSHLSMLDCLFATKQFNDARGVHQVDLDAELIRRMSEAGATDEEICERLQMQAETVHRYKQLTGVWELFKNVDYSMSWEMVEVEDRVEDREVAA